MQGGKKLIKNAINMKTILSPLEGKSLRCRIDGINFTSIKIFDHLKNIPKEDENYFKSSIISDAINKIASIFRFDRNDKCITVIKSKLTINLNDIHGIYIEAFFKGCDFFVLIQFKGYFFIQDGAFGYCQSIMMKMVEVFDNYFRISLIDAAQDFYVSIKEVLPNPNIVSDDLKYCFKYKSFDYHEKTKSGLEHTGFVISSSRFKITLYNKLLENKGSKKADKKKYYEELYGKYSNVTRVELRLKQELCKSLTKQFFSPFCYEDEFIIICLRNLFKKHKLRYRVQNSKDKDFRRWPIHPNWEYLFGRAKMADEEYCTMPDYKYTSGNQDISKALNLLIETLANNSPFIEKEELLKKLDLLDMDKILQRVKENSKKRGETRNFLKLQKDELLNKYKHGNWLDLTSGDSSITSPVKRNPNENPEVYGESYE